MRVIVTPLLDKGVPLKTRAMPIDAHMRSTFDDAHRQVLQLWEPGRDKPMWSHLIHPQLSEVRERTLVFHGYEKHNGSQLVAQAWEVEAPSRR